MKKPTTIIKPIDKEEKMKKFQEASAKRLISVVDPEKEVGYFKCYFRCWLDGGAR